jgi:hypothetical protein
VFTKNIQSISCRPMNPLTPMSTKNGYQVPYTKSGSQAHTYKNDTQGAPRAPPKVLCQPEVPHQLGALQLQEAVDQSSLPPPLLLYGLGSTTLLVPPHTSPGPPHPGCGPICPQAHPVEPARNVFTDPPA